ncbi:hypothetical protein GUITHDRAFT_151567, partial [Guillardia theta CCMP2712]
MSRRLAGLLTLLEYLKWKLQFPFRPCEMQWLHTLLSLKFALYALFYDGIVYGATTALWCLLVAKGLEGVGRARVGTWSNAYFLHRLSFTMASLSMQSSLLEQVPQHSFWIMYTLFLLLLASLGMMLPYMSIITYYSSIIIWELAVLPCVQVVYGDLFFSLSPLSSNFHWPWSIAFLLSL